MEVPYLYKVLEIDSSKETMHCHETLLRLFSHKHDLTLQMKQARQDLARAEENYSKQAKDQARRCKFDFVLNEKDRCGPSAPATTTPTEYQKGPVVPTKKGPQQARGLKQQRSSKDGKGGQESQFTNNKAKTSCTSKTNSSNTSPGQAVRSSNQVAGLDGATKVPAAKMKKTSHSSHISSLEINACGGIDEVRSKELSEAGLTHFPQNSKVKQKQTWWRKIFGNKRQEATPPPPPENAYKAKVTYSVWSMLTRISKSLFKLSWQSRILSEDEKRSVLGTFPLPAMFEVQTHRTLIAQLERQLQDLETTYQAVTEKLSDIIRASYAKLWKRANPDKLKKGKSKDLWEEVVFAYHIMMDQRLRALYIQMNDHDSFMAKLASGDIIGFDEIERNSGSCKMSGSGGKRKGREDEASQDETELEATPVAAGKKH
jgi:hypothetical protein